MPVKDIHQTVALKNVTPHEVYESLMDSKQHAAFTGAKAKMSREIGGKCEAYDGWIEAFNVELVPDEKIVQKWRGADWAEDVYSVATFKFAKIGADTKLTFTQIGVPV